MKKTVFIAGLVVFVIIVIFLGKGILFLSFNNIVMNFTFNIDFKFVATLYLLQNLNFNLISNFKTVLKNLKIFQ